VSRRLFRWCVEILPAELDEQQTILLFRDREMPCRDPGDLEMSSRRGYVQRSTVHCVLGRPRTKRGQQAGLSLWTLNEIRVFDVETSATSDVQPQEEGGMTFNR
jgi:hypothetical protein